MCALAHILFYVTSAHLQVFLRTLESNLVYAKSSNRIFGNRKFRNWHETAKNALDDGATFKIYRCQIRNNKKVFLKISGKLPLTVRNNFVAGSFPNTKIYYSLSTGTITKTLFFIYIKILFKEKCFDIFHLIYWLRQSIPRLMIKKKTISSKIDRVIAIYVLKNTDFRSFFMTKNWVFLIFI